MAVDILERDSVDYLELLAEVFAQIVQKGFDGKSVTKAADGEVTPALMQCLQYIYLHGACSIGRIAEGLSVSVPASSQLVDRLAHKGLISRHGSEEDRRMTRIELTESGINVVRQARSERGQWFRELCEKLPVERKSALMDGLEEFISLALTTEDDVDKACVKCGIDHLAFCVLNRAHMAAAGTPLENY
jgi:DNA-binding MarR family transcriptional regulator